jgi:hypothetical protein
MDKAGVWMVYDYESGLVCLGSYEMCKTTYEDYAESARDHVQREGEFSSALDEIVVLARVEKMIHPDQVEDGVYDWKEENDEFTAEGDQSTE